MTPRAARRRPEPDGASVIACSRGIIARSFFAGIAYAVLMAAVSCAGATAPSPADAGPGGEDAGPSDGEGDAGSSMPCSGGPVTFQLSAAVGSPFYCVGAQGCANVSWLSITNVRNEEVALAAGCRLSLCSDCVLRGCPLDCTLPRILNVEGESDRLGWQRLDYFHLRISTAFLRSNDMRHAGQIRREDVRAREQRLGRRKAVVRRGVHGRADLRRNGIRISDYGDRRRCTALKKELFYERASAVVGARAQASDHVRRAPSRDPDYTAPVAARRRRSAPHTKGRHT